MSTPQAYLNGRWLPASELTIPVYDAGFVLGAAVTEQLRTFAGKIFCLDAHLQRLAHSLKIVGIEPDISLEELGRIAQEVVARNHPLLAEGDDLGLGMFITPGVYPTFADGAAAGPTVCVYSYRLPFGQWAEKYSVGESVLISDIQQVSPRSWPPELKCRSRMHYFLADRRAAAAEPGSRAILLDEQGFLSEATTANIVLYRTAEGLLSPPREKILPGISLQVLARLAEGLNIPLTHRDISPEEMNIADEVFLTSTSVCVLPVVRAGKVAIGSGKPGPVFTELLAAWSTEVGLDIAEQARRFAQR